VPEPTPQETADQINLGAHQVVLKAEDENGAVLKFVVHRPNMREQIRIGVAAAALTATETTAKDGEATVGQPQTLSPVYQNLAAAIATLNVVVDMRPAGTPTDAGEWLDETLTWNVYQAFGAWLDSFRQPVSPAGGGDSGTPEPA
jgi:hypothetical protein